MEQTPLAPVDIANQFVGRLDGGASVNQRSLMRAFELFGAKKKAAYCS